MNTEQTEKSLGQWAYEAFPPIPGADVPWRNSLHKDGWEKAAQAVATEVLNRLPGEWILLHEEEIIEIGDEKYSVGMWAPVSVNVLGKMVGGRIVRRRLSVSPVPSINQMFIDEAERESRKWRNTNQGKTLSQMVMPALQPCPHGMVDTIATSPPPAPRAEWKPKFKVGDTVCRRVTGQTTTIKEVLYDKRKYTLTDSGFTWSDDELEPAPWKLPEPPEKVQTDMFAMLQSIIKDLAEGNRVRQEFIDWVLGDVKAVYEVASTPLHAPSIPQPEEIPYEETDLFHARKALLDEGMRANTLKQERDAALARASEVEKQLADIQREFGRIQGTSAKSVVDRFLDLMRKLNEKDLPAGFESWESFLKYIDGIKARAVAAESELATARASVPVWVPIETHPTDITARILYHDGKRAVADGSWNMGRPTWARFWCPFPPLPVETGEDAFEKWWTVISQDWTGIQSAQWFAEQAWQAALSSTKP
jgi:hypothetical protein